MKENYENVQFDKVVCIHLILEGFVSEVIVDAFLVNYSFFHYPDVMIIIIICSFMRFSILVTSYSCEHET